MVISMTIGNGLLEHLAKIPVSSAVPLKSNDKFLTF